MKREAGRWYCWYMAATSYRDSHSDVSHKEWVPSPDDSDSSQQLQRLSPESPSTWSSQGRFHSLVWSVGLKPNPSQNSPSCSWWWKHSDVKGYKKKKSLSPLAKGTEAQKSLHNYFTSFMFSTRQSGFSPSRLSGIKYSNSLLHLQFLHHLQPTHP